MLESLLMMISLNLKVMIMDIKKLSESELAFYKECSDLVGMTVEEFLRAGI